MTAGASPYVSGIEGATGQVFASAAIGGTAAQLGGGKFANGAITGAYSGMYGAYRRSEFRRAKSDADLQKQNGWKKGDSKIVSFYRALDKTGGVNSSFSHSGNKNFSHEGIAWMKPDGNVVAMGYTPDGIKDENINYDQAIFGEATRVPDGTNPFTVWEESGRFQATQDGGKVLGNQKDGYGFLNYNCQDAANWLHGRFR